MEKAYSHWTFFSLASITGACRLRAGVVIDKGSVDQGEWFNIWSSSRNSNSWNAWNMNGNSKGCNLNNNNRYNGLSIRGVLGALVFIYFLLYANYKRTTST